MLQIIHPKGNIVYNLVHFPQLTFIRAVEWRTKVMLERRFIA